MTPAQPRKPLQQRIYQQMAEELTARMEGQALSWPAFFAAERRLQGRVRLTIGRRLGAPDTDRDMADALMVLAEDSPAQAAHDAAVVRRWDQAHGIVEDAAGARARIAQRLEEMAERQQAYDECYGL
jgi:hypothetical protein